MSGVNINELRAVGDVVDIVQTDGAVLAGTIVEDYAGTSMAIEDFGRNWAQPRRWAVALETGVLVFVDDADLTEGDDEPAVSKR
ncbi:hypothetical protein QMK17_16085 [Rhodococcus sp. G-MC3]|uniref:hypothetical protein n=1 Tax=Rhodococcus sp. G-MC3 TaxID=3046209 RepID=UPI0024BA2660|nr:hypothetical protein [Rhodococcus sp. G-MC3]MDJ0394844.1 hypothetical protein [Rhodococcus sp. G-MC3]